MATEKEIKDFAQTLGRSKNQGEIFSAEQEIMIEILKEFHKEQLEVLMENYRESFRSDSGNAVQALQAVPEPTSNGVSYTLKIGSTNDEYINYIEDGVSGTNDFSDVQDRSQAYPRPVVTNGKYRFKNNYPSRQMVDSIRDWFSLSRTRVPAGLGADTYAYLVARSVKRHGIKPSKFIERSYGQDRVDALKEKISEALGRAIEIGMKNKFKKQFK